MECEPGEEAQVDYGEMRILQNEKGNLVKVYLLRVVLSCSRKSYTEASRRMNTEGFIRGLENAFRYFGGVPRRLCPDMPQSGRIESRLARTAAQSETGALQSITVLP